MTEVWKPCASKLIFVPSLKVRVYVPSEFLRKVENSRAGEVNVLGPPEKKSAVPSPLVSNTPPTDWRWSCWRSVIAQPTPKALLLRLTTITLPVEIPPTDELR